MSLEDAKGLWDAMILAQKNGWNLDAVYLMHRHQWALRHALPFPLNAIYLSIARIGGEFLTCYDHWRGK
jgi:hypothetical protein